MTIDEKRFLRREMINSVIHWAYHRNIRIGFYQIITRVRVAELGTYGQILSVYTRRK